MVLKRRRHQEQAWGLGSQRNAREIASAGEIAPVQVPFDAHPVIQGLKRKVDVLIRLDFNDREPPVAIDGQQVDHAAVAAGELKMLALIIKILSFLNLLFSDLLLIIRENQGCGNSSDLLVSYVQRQHGHW
jgi:hypothetical protein